MRLLILTVLAGCSINPGVSRTGDQSYMLTRQAASALSGMGGLKIAGLREANDYCASIQREIKVTHISESEPPYLLGNYPRVEINFECLVKEK